jgi:hypothetical protein
LGLPVVDHTAAGLPSVNIVVLKKLVGDPEKKQGLLYKFYKDKKQEEKGLAAQKAFESFGYRDFITNLYSSIARDL